MITSRGTCKATSTANANSPSHQDHCQEQYLFLLEFYVREIKSSRLAKLNEMFFVPTTVSFCFLDFDTDDKLQVTPVNPTFEPQAGIADDVEAFNNGRSVLFALSREALANMHSEFKINLSVNKRMPVDIKPDVLVGNAQIDMTLQFAALRKETIDLGRYGDSATPKPSKALEADNVALVLGDCSVGSIDAYVRVSAYGQTIVTEFESARQGDDISRASAFLFRSNERDQDGRYLGYNCRALPDDCSDITSLSSFASCCKKSTRQTSTCLPCRVDSGARLVKKRSTTMMENTTSCCVGAARANDDNDCRTIQTSRGPREPCGKAVVLKVSGLLDTNDDQSRKNKEPARVTVTGENEAATRNDLDDPDHDVFVLRIGKKGLVGENEKSDIQLEMRTPKGRDKRPPARLETREMQTEEVNAGKNKGKEKGDKKSKKKNKK